jgi:colanic acid/amylovoran biosynthesis glycosyltransferase
MKKVLHYKDGPYLPLTENWIYEIVGHHRRYLPFIYCHGILNRESFPANNIRSLESDSWNKNPAIFFNLLWNKFFGFYPYFYYSLRKDKPTVIHAHFGSSGHSILRIKKMFNIPLITTFYGQDLSMLPNKFPKWKEKYKKLFQEGELFLIEGSHMKKSLTNLGCPENKIKIQHQGIDLKKIPFILRNIERDKEIKVLISASFREKKGIPYAVEAIGIVRKKLPKIKIKLTIIGDSTGDKEGEIEKRKILDTVERYNLKATTKMLGFQPHRAFLQELYEHHIFLSPSVTASTGDTEGGAPVSIIEASASGIPVVSTFHCDIPEVILNNKSGYLVKEKGVKGLAEKLYDLISNPSIWEKMGKVGRSHIEKNYNIKKQVIKLEKIYDSLL